MIALARWALAAAVDVLLATSSEAKTLQGNCIDRQDLGLEDLRVSSWSYYRSTGAFDWTLLGLLSTVWEHMDSVEATCAPAVLVAQLLKAEERALLGAAEVDYFTARYASLLQKAVQQERIGAIDFNEWPLELGLQKVRTVREELSVSLLDTPRVDMVMNFCSVHDRLGVEQSLGWLQEEPLRGRLRAVGVRLVLYLVDQPHCDSSRGQFDWLANAIGEVQFVEYRGSSLREEQTAYFKYLADNYGNLPEFVIFVHPDAPEHQGDNFAALSRALQLLQTKSAFAHRALQYFPLSLQLIKNPARTEFDGHPQAGTNVIETWSEFWDSLFGKHQNAICPNGCPWNADMRDSFQMYVASQSIVGKDRILAHPHSFYESLARDLDFCGNYSGLLEAAWHVLFGEPLKTLPREGNPDVPLALKWGVPTITSYGTLGVI